MRPVQNTKHNDHRKCIGKPSVLGEGKIWEHGHTEKRKLEILGSCTGANWVHRRALKGYQRLNLRHIS